MDLNNLPQTLKLALVLVSVFFSYHTIHAIILTQKRRALAREKGCLPSPIHPQWDRILGIDVFRESMRAFKERRFLEVSRNRFKLNGVNTYHVVALGRRMYMTMEPENLKVIQAVEFKKWGLGERRKAAFMPLLGPGKRSSISSTE